MRVCAPVFAALVLTVTIVLLRSPGLFHEPVSTPAVESIAAGDSEADKNLPARADLPHGSVTLSSGGTVPFMNLFSGNSINSFPMVQIDGVYYRMLNEPQNLSQQYIGQSMGKVSFHTSGMETAASGIASNMILEGETVYQLQSMKGAAAVARVNGENRVFQRVSFNGQGIPGSMADLFGNAAVTSISLSGVGQVTDAGTIRRLMQVLTNRSTYLSGSCSATTQGLYITYSSGVTLQWYVSGTTVMGCGAWSCGEFMEEFRQVAR